MKLLRETAVDKKIENKRDREIDELRKEIAKLKQKESLQSWKENPDRMGGAFTKEEIENATAWR